MDLEALALSQEATLRRFDKLEERKIRQDGFGATTASQGIVRQVLKEVSLFIEEKLKDPPKIVRPLAYVIRNLDPDVLAQAALSMLLHSIAIGCNLRAASSNIGRVVQGECWAAGLLAHDARLHARIQRVTRQRHSNIQYRRQAARSLAKAAGFRTDEWDRELEILAGSFLMDCCVQALPDVFLIEDSARHVVKYPQITPGGLEIAEAAVDAAVQRSPVFLPCTVPPQPWTGFRSGGYWDKRTVLSAAFLRTRYKSCVAAAKAAMREGTLKPHVDAVNTLQAVPWRINQAVLNVVKWAYEHNVPVTGLPSALDVPLPERLDEEVWTNDEDARKVQRLTINKIKQRNRGLSSDRLLFAEDIATASRLTGGCFFTPANADWRGRLYPVPHFNFQRDDRVRALFLFDRGMPVGQAEGLYWLKVHAANCYGFDKVPFAEREAWATQNLARMEAVAWDPKEKTQVSWWTQAEKPFLFLAACIELSEALATGPSFVTRLPVSFDGSCSGLQHLCAMTRASEGSLVNLTPSDRPQDVYQKVADIAKARIEHDAAKTLGPQDIPEMARMCLAYGITRKLVKRNVMTYSYSSKAFGMAYQHMEDTMRGLDVELLEHKIAAHPFACAGDTLDTADGKLCHMGNGYAASRYLAGHIYAAIESVVALPADAMSFLQKIARAMAHEGKPVCWTTPTGVPWANRYHEPSTKSVQLWLSDVRTAVTVGDGVNKDTKIDKTRAVNGVAPNFVHACDASHLALTVNAAAREGINDVATVHDSFGCLAPQAARFRRIIREQFVEMYETHDVLAEVLVQAQRDLTVHNHGRLPVLPQAGPLDLKEVLNAEYAFA